MGNSSASTVGGSKRREADASSTQPAGILAANGPQKVKKTDALATLLTEISDDKIDEAIAQLMGRKKKPKKESTSLSLKSRLKESDSKTKTSRYRVILIQEGLGNFNDAFFYTREALESAVAQFEGKKIFANHPSKSEDADRPERDVRDILGHYENVALEEVDGRAEVHADLVIPEGANFDWARGMADAALTYREKYGDKDFVGLSINASGDADESDIDDVMSSAPEACVPKLNEAKEKGVTTVRVVTRIDDAVSTDLVTEAGAGGKFLKLLEEAKAMSEKQVDEGGPGSGPHKGGGGSAKAQADRKAKMQKAMWDTRLAQTASKKRSDAVKAGLQRKRANDNHSDSMKATMKARTQARKNNESEDQVDDEKDQHADAEQDKMLIKDMMKKHLGDGATEDDEKECHEAYEGYKEMGMESEEAMKCAAAHHKVEKMKKEKMKQAKEAEPKENEAEETHEAAAEEKHENKESQVVALGGRVAFLERELKKERLSKYVDKKLAESKLERSVTNQFRETAGAFRDEKDFDTKWKLFTAAFAEGAKQEQSDFSLVLGAEKTNSAESTESTFSAADCVTE